MKKDFTKGMLQNVKFFVPDEHKHLIMPFIDSINSKYNDLIEKNIEQSIAFHIGHFATYLDRILPFSSLDYYRISELKCVSMFEAIPELIPGDMRYNKELDKLVPDVISASNEYCSGIKIEAEKVKNYTEEILQRENGFIKADKEKINFSLVDPYAYEDLGKCLTIGAKKYHADNWKLGDIESYISALDRHLLDIKKAVTDKDKSLFIDRDTMLQHGANLICNAMFIHYFIRKELEEK